MANDILNGIVIALRPVICEDIAKIIQKKVIVQNNIQYKKTKFKDIHNELKWSFGYIYSHSLQMMILPPERKSCISRRIIRPNRRQHYNGKRRVQRQHTNNYLSCIVCGSLLNCICIKKYRDREYT